MHIVTSDFFWWRFCHVDSSIRLDEWKLMGAFHHTDRPDGRARVQFGVIIGRALGDKSKVMIFFGLQESHSWAIFWLQKRAFFCFFGHADGQSIRKSGKKTFLFGPTHVRWLYVLRAERLDNLVPGLVIFCDPLEAGGKVTILRGGGGNSWTGW